MKKLLVVMLVLSSVSVMARVTFTQSRVSDSIGARNVASANSLVGTNVAASRVTGFANGIGYINNTQYRFQANVVNGIVTGYTVLGVVSSQ